MLVPPWANDYVLWCSMSSMYIVPHWAIDNWVSYCKKGNVSKWIRTPVYRTKAKSFNLLATEACVLDIDNWWIGSWFIVRGSWPESFVCSPEGQVWIFPVPSFSTVMAVCHFVSHFCKFTHSLLTRLVAPPVCSFTVFVSVGLPNMAAPIVVSVLVSAIKGLGCCQ